MSEVSVLEVGLRRILGDVATEFLKGVLSAHQMVEAFVLPETASLTECGVDLFCGPALPGLHLGQHGLTRQTTDEDMQMIGHHHEVSQSVALPVKETEGIDDDLTEFLLVEHAGTVAGIHFMLKMSGKLSEIPSVLRGQFFQVPSPVALFRINAVGM